MARRMDCSFPPEWAPHEAVLLAWPHDSSLWEDDLLACQREFLDLLEAIQKPGSLASTEKIYLLHPNSALDDRLHNLVKSKTIEVLTIPYGDIWLRDTAPIFSIEDKTLRAHCFGFNGWGEKYVLPGDFELAQNVSKALDISPVKHDLILEGGSMEFNGSGTALSTRECLFHPKRNPLMGESQILESLQEIFSLDKIVLLDRGLKNDHTDGHIDNLARFVAKDQVVCLKASTPRDPNRETLEENEKMLKKSLPNMEIIPIEAAQDVLDDDSRWLPASYMNFYIANNSVIVPTFERPQDDAALKRYEEIFPTRQIIGLNSRAILSGGGSFHCITQQIPRRSIG